MGAAACRGLADLAAHPLRLLVGRCCVCQSFPRPDHRPLRWRVGGSVRPHEDSAGHANDFARSGARAVGDLRQRQHQRLHCFRADAGIGCQRGDYPTRPPRARATTGARRRPEHRACLEFGGVQLRPIHRPARRRRDHQRQQSRHDVPVQCTVVPGNDRRAVARYTDEAGALADQAVRAARSGSGHQVRGGACVDRAAAAHHLGARAAGATRRGPFARLRRPGVPSRRTGSCRLHFTHGHRLDHRWRVACTTRRRARPAGRRARLPRADRGDAARVQRHGELLSRTDHAAHRQRRHLRLRHRHANPRAARGGRRQTRPRAGHLGTDISRRAVPRRARHGRTVRLARHGRTRVRRRGAGDRLRVVCAALAAVA